LTNLIRLLTALVLNVVTVGFLGWGVPGVLGSNLTGAVVGLALAWTHARRDLAFRWNREAFDRLARFGFPLVLGGFAIFVMGNGDRYFLRAFAEPRDLGVYSLAYKFGLIMSLLVNAFVVAWPPLLFQISREPAARETYARMLVYYLLVTIPVFLVLTAFRLEFVTLVGTERFLPAAGVLGFIVAAYLCYGLYHLFSVGVVLRDKTHTIPMILGVCVTVSAGLNILLVPRYSILGAGWAIAVSYALLALLMLLVSRRYYPIPYETGKLFRLGLLTALLFAACLGLVRGTSWTAGAMKVLILGLFLPGIVILRVVDPEETSRLRRLVRRRLGRGHG
jgi:O-antigen/teichoic acid export membrane protein